MKVTEKGINYEIDMFYAIIRAADADSGSANPVRIAEAKSGLLRANPEVGFDVVE